MCGVTILILTSARLKSVMLFPKKVKYRKWQRMRKKNPGVETRGVYLAFGSYGLKSMGDARITSQQIEAARKVISRAIQKTGKMWIRIFPDRSITKKPPEVKMGKGKGDPMGFMFPVRRGRILFEVDGITNETAQKVLRGAGNKLPLKTKVISRE